MMSNTARITAAIRARHTLEEGGLCHDPWAVQLTDDGGRRLLASAVAAVPDVDVAVAVRTALFDELVAATPHGQVVLLGAGLDTRAVRLARTGLRFFEVDQPLTQASKRELVEALPGYPVEAAHYVPHDLQQDGLLDALRTAGFDPDAPALVLMEGVSAYLTARVMGRLLGTIGRFATGSPCVFDLLTAAARPQQAATADRVQQVAVQAGEVMRWRPADPSRELTDAGFAHHELQSLSRRVEERAGYRAPMNGMLSLWKLATLVVP